jgi:hypothetical protein
MKRKLRRDLQFLWARLKKVPSPKQGPCRDPGHSFSDPHSLTRSIYTDVVCGDAGNLILFIETLLYTFAWSSLSLHMESRPRPSLSGLTDGEAHVAQQFDSRYGLRKAETRNVNCRLVCLRTKATTALCFPVPEWPARPRTPATGVGVEPAMVLEGTDHIAMPPRRTGRTESVIMAVEDSIFVAASGVC